MIKIIFLLASWSVVAPRSWVFSRPGVAVAVIPLRQGHIFIQARTFSPLAESPPRTAEPARSSAAVVDFRRKRIR